MSENELAHGVDRDQLRTFAEHAAENPEDVQLGLGARATYEGTCAHSLGQIDGYELGGDTIARETRSYTIPYGGWREVLEAAGWEGPTDRMEPIEVALSALAACVNVGITINALAAGIDFDRLTTNVRTDFDPSVLFSVADLHKTDSVFEHLTIEIEIDGEDIDKDLVDEWARRAPVYTLISSEQDAELSIKTPTAVPAGTEVK